MTTSRVPVVDPPAGNHLAVPPPKTDSVLHVAPPPKFLPHTEAGAVMIIAVKLVNESIVSSKQSTNTIIAP